MSATNTIRGLLSHRGTAAFLGAIIGPASLWLLLLNVTRIYMEYFFYPRVKAGDGYYPQLRYAAFDAVLIPWCVLGVVTSCLLFRVVISSRKIEGWTHRLTVLYFAGFVFLIVAVRFGMWLRSAGY